MIETIAPPLLLGVISGVIANTITTTVLQRRAGTPVHLDIAAVWPIFIATYASTACFLAMSQWCAPRAQRFGYVTLLLLAAWAGTFAKERAPTILAVRSHCVVGGGLLTLLFAIHILIVPHQICVACPLTLRSSQPISGLTTGNGYVYALVSPRGENQWRACKAARPDPNGEWTSLCRFDGSPGDDFDIMAFLGSCPNAYQFNEPVPSLPEQPASPICTAPRGPS